MGRAIDVGWNEKYSDSGNKAVLGINTLKASKSVSSFRFPNSYSSLGYYTLRSNLSSDFQLPHISSRGLNTYLISRNWSQGSQRSVAWILVSISLSRETVRPNSASGPESSSNSHFPVPKAMVHSSFQSSKSDFSVPWNLIGEIMITNQSTAVGERYGDVKSFYLFANLLLRMPTGRSKRRCCGCMECSSMTARCDRWSESSKFILSLVRLMPRLSRCT